MPIVAFIILFFSLSLPKRIVQIYAISTLLSPVLFSATFSDKPDPEATFSVSTGITQGSHELHLNFEGVGPLIKIKEESEARAKRVQRALATLSSLSSRSNNEPIAFVVGSMQPTLESRWDIALGKNVHFYYAISAKTMRELKRKKVHVYVSPLGEYYSKKKYKFTVIKNGGKQIRI